MKNKKLTVVVGVYMLVCAGIVWHFAIQNRALRREIATLRTSRTAEPRRPQMKFPPSPPRRASPARPHSGPVEQRIAPVAARTEQPAGEVKISEERIDAAVKDRIATLRQQAEDARARRREAIAALTQEQKEEQREAFIGKMRERAQQRLKAFVSNTGLDDKQAAAFESTVSALDATLRETANAWAEQVRKTGTFSRDAQVRFVSDVSTVISAGYSEMDATLPSSWRDAEGNVNLMEIVGPEALSSMVEALTESGLEDGLQTIGQIMGGPSGEGGEAPGGFEGIESPGVGGGPGSMNIQGGAPAPTRLGGPGAGGPGM